MRTQKVIEKMGRVLDHASRSRLARTAQRESGLTVDEIAGRAGVHRDTAANFLGLTGERSTRDPRTSTTMKVMAAVGYECRFERRFE